jgi:hypothetical protein
MAQSYSDGRRYDLGELDVHLDDIACLLRHQLSRGHTDLLEHIFAKYTLPFDIGSFEDFASPGWKSIRTLVLCVGVCYPDGDNPLSELRFTDLPRLVTVVQHDLPNLRDLRISMEGIEGAESAAKSMLHPQCLEGYGNLTRLSISTQDCNTPLFNLLRVAAPICAENATLHIQTGSKTTWSKIAQSDYINYLRA